ncbi:ABC transporter substrate-binding protein [Saccharomonospora sp.]|uniref:ABC transporter substrate-binding protein n=1 Tax=Saccharomonospora sp. TaxID=33913 RepID=UPI002616FCFF|nr:ABC transporter substrate-binding protein [Saccharomonospora sp.]
MRTHGRVLFVLTVVLLLSACSVFTETVDDDRFRPETEILRIGVGNAVETAPLRLAVSEGLFHDEGLRVELMELSEEDNAVALLTNGEVDIVSAGDVHLLSAAAEGVKLQLQGEAYVAGSGSMALVTLPESHYTSLSELPAPRIAVPTQNGLGTLTARSVLESAGVDPNMITFEVVPFERMVNALRSGQVDAAWLSEPYLAEAQKEHGARVLADCAHGATETFPMSAYAATEEFATRNPQTLALFRQLLEKAQQRGSDTGVIRRSLPQLADVDEVTAALVSLGTYPHFAHAERLQRVADLMHGSGLLSQRLDVTSLVPEREIS